MSEMNEAITKLLKGKVMSLLSNSDGVEVLFIKANGEERTMICTRNTSYIPKADLPKPVTEDYTPKPENPDVVKVYDVEKKAWRSFRLDSIIKFQPLELPTAEFNNE